MTHVGIVGAEAAKFTAVTAAKARAIIAKLLAPDDAVLVSGRCHLGGVDVWAEEEADRLGRPKIIHPAKELTWSTGYRPRNIKIAEDADIVHVIVVAVYPAHYADMRFELCYHCRSRSHVKSGGCWTAHFARGLGKTGHWHIV